MLIMFCIKENKLISLIIKNNFEETLIKTHLKI